jgi:uncharacterized protein YdbL (DUF1318 family)
VEGAMSIERSHGKPRLTRPRLSDTPLVPTDLNRRRRDHASDGRFKPGNAAAGGRGAKGVIERPEESAQAALGSLANDGERARLVQDIRTLYRATKRDLASDSPIVLASAATFARECVLAGYLLTKAVAEGITSPRGMQLLELAQKSEARAERASVLAVTMASKMARAGAGAIDATPPWLQASDEPEGEP